MNDKNNKNTINFPKGKVEEKKPEEKKKEKEYVIYMKNYVPFTIIFADGTMGKGKEMVCIKENSLVKVSDIEAFIVKGLAEKGVTVQDIVIDNMLPETAIKVPAEQVIEHVKPLEDKK